MIDHTPGGWRRERGGPQHAATAGRPGPLRRHGRLIVAAGAWGAELCLVIALVTLVAQSAMPGRPTHTGRYSGAITGTAYVGYIKRISGTGRKATSFSVDAHSRWELRWSYRCPAGQDRGHLTITEMASRAGARVDAVGAAGRGTAWSYSDQSHHLLVIISSCPWAVAVAGRR